VHADLLAASRPGTTLGTMLDIAQRSYQRQGFPDEWQHHHQGGLAGYEPREVRATPGANYVLEAGQLVAWNPTIRGAKAEETALVTAAGPRILTRTDGWPLLAGPIPLAAIGVV
jgi:antitoxin VapB